MRTTLELFRFSLFVFPDSRSVSHSELSELKPCKIFEFRNLLVYQKAKEFHKSLSAISQNLPLSKIVQNQLYRASFSIPLNIAEGSGRFGKSDRRNFFVIARSSVIECIAILDILKDGKKISEEQFNNFEALGDELSRILSMAKNLDIIKKG